MIGLLLFIIINMVLLATFHYRTRDILLRRYLLDVCDRVMEAYANDPRVPEEGFEARAEKLADIIKSHYRRNLIMSYKEICDEVVFTEEERRILFNNEK